VRQSRSAQAGACALQDYYVAGGVLTVGFLGAGSAWLLLPRRGRDVLLGALASGSLAAVATIWLAPVDAHALATTASGQPPENGALVGHAFLWAVLFNSPERSCSWAARCTRSCGDDA